MSSYEYAMRVARFKFESLPWFRRQWHENKTLRYATLALAANIVGYTLVHILTQKGVGNWVANETVSKGMAPVGLAMNTLALTGRYRPTLRQAIKWAAYWAPSAIVGAACMGLVVAKFGLGSLESRAVAGLMMFPLDYSIKRFVIFANEFKLANRIRLKLAVFLKTEA
jgi:hypothetical protein